MNVNIDSQKKWFLFHLICWDNNSSLFFTYNSSTKILSSLLNATVRKSLSFWSSFKTVTFTRWKYVESETFFRKPRNCFVQPNTHLWLLSSSRGVLGVKSFALKRSTRLQADCLARSLQPATLKEPFGLISHYCKSNKVLRHLFFIYVFYDTFKLSIVYFACVIHTY